MHPENILIIADSEREADILYPVGMNVPDPFIYLRLRGRSIVVMSDLEIDRARHEAPHCRVLSLAKYSQKIRARGASEVSLPLVVREILKEQQIRSVSVPASFPIGYANELSKVGVKIKVLKGNCFPEREFKTPEEIKKISAAVIMAEVGMSEAIQVLKRSKIGRDGRLVYRNQNLTSESLQAIISSAIYEAGGFAGSPIVACGSQSCDPHERGHGPLRAHQPIILDIFPRSRKTGYFGDITRTVVKGRASDGIRRIYATVAKAQCEATKLVRVNGEMKAVHQAVQQTFDENGFKTRRRKGHMEGFFHGTGHGLGLEIHEAPRITALSDSRFVSGQVVTIEPGLYYPGLGGVRLEDDLVVVNGTPRNLTRFEKVLEL